MKYLIPAEVILDKQDIGVYLDRNCWGGHVYFDRDAPYELYQDDYGNWIVEQADCFGGWEYE